MDNQQIYNRYKKPLVVIGVILVIIFFGLWLYHILSLGKLTVSTSTGNTVSITPVVGGKQVSSSTSVAATNSLTKKVSAGTYQISARSKTSMVSRVVSIKSRQSLSYYLAPLTASSPEPVYGNSVSNVVADNNQVVFIDNDNQNTLSSINSSNTVTELYSTTALYDAAWANTDLGLAHDINNNLYLIKNGVVSHVVLPFQVTQDIGFVLSYSIAPNGEIYVSNGKSIYKESSSGSFSKIYTSKFIVFGLSASNTNLAAINTVSNNFQDLDGNLMIIDNSGNVRYSPTNTSHIVWSPDGKYMVISNTEEEDQGFAIYSASLQKIASIPATSASHFGWTSSDDLIYNQGESLWIYDVKSGLSNEVAVSPNHSNILEISPATNSSYVYIVTASTNASAGSGANQLFRVKLGAQSLNNQSLIGIPVVLPASLNGGLDGYCYVNYVNFSTPTITIGFVGNSNATQSNCFNLTQSTLNQYYINPGVFSYKFLPQVEE